MAGGNTHQVFPDDATKLRALYPGAAGGVGNVFVIDLEGFTRV